MLLLVCATAPMLVLCCGVLLCVACGDGEVLLASSLPPTPPRPHTPGFSVLQIMSEFPPSMRNVVAVIDHIINQTKCYVDFNRILLSGGTVSPIPPQKDSS